jgi:hypothetical protein
MPKILDRPRDPVSIEASGTTIVLRIKEADYGNRLLRLSPSEARLIAYALLAEAEKLAEKSN